MNVAAPLAYPAAFGVFGLLGGFFLAGHLSRKAYLRSSDVQRRPPVSRARVLWASSVGGAVVGGTTAASRPLLAAALLIISVVAVWVTVVDLDVHRIPNAASGTAMVVSFGYVVIDGGVTAQMQRVLLAVGAAAFVGIVGLLVAWFGGAGLGDVKLAAALAPIPAYLGLGAIVVATTTVAIAGLVIGVTALRRRQAWSARLPAGPAIIYGVLMGLCVRILIAP